MPAKLTYEMLKPGDLLLCYGWNTVGKLQGTVRTLHRTFNLATLPLSAPVRLIDPVPYFSGTAKCNHAILVGEDAFEADGADFTQVKILSDAPPGTRVALRQVDQNYVVECTGRGGEVTTIDLAPFIATFGGTPSRPIFNPVEKAVYVQFPRVVGRVRVPRLCHSTGGGCVWAPAQGYLAQHTGALAAFRMRAATEPDALAAAAAKVASTWAIAADNPPNGTQYSHWKAFKSAFGSHIFGPSASSRAKLYRANAQTAGGPLSSNRTKARQEKKKEWFCSMFVIACYQAATADDAQAKKYLPLDAKHTTPMTLDGFLKGSNKWELVGST